MSSHSNSQTIRYSNLMLNHLRKKGVEEKKLDAKLCASISFIKSVPMAYLERLNENKHRKLCPNFPLLF